MSLFLITGWPATGKSTVCTELRKRGYAAYDGDNDYLSWFFDKTGRPVLIPDEERTLDFVLNHPRIIHRDIIKAFANEYENKPAFICNNPQNEPELQDLFDKIFALVIDVDTMKHRLATRTTNTWGKLPYELQYTLDNLQERDDMYERYSYTKVDALQPIKGVVDQILEEAGL